MLFEIASWSAVHNFVKPVAGPVVASEMRSMLVEKVRKRLPHQAGEIFTRCILTCFDFGKLTIDLDEYER